MKAAVPQQASVFANVTAYLRKTPASGDVKETRNGGRLECKVIRIPELADKAGGNPWRIHAFKALPAWDQDGTDFWGAQ